MKTPHTPLPSEQPGGFRPGASGGISPGVSRRSGPVDVTAVCALGAAMILWSSTFIFMKVVVAEYHPITMTFTRMAVSALLLAPFIPRWLREVRYAKGDWRIMALLVLAEPCMYFIFEGYAMRYTTASQAAMVIATLPLIVGVGAWIILRERLSLTVWAGFSLAVGGVALLTFTGESTESAPDPLWGNLLEFMAAIMAAGYTICVRRLAAYPPFFIVALQVVGGTVFFALLMPISGAGVPEHIHLVPTLLLFALAGMSIFPYGLYNFGIARLSAGQAAAWSNLIPGITLLMGFFFLSESFTALQYLALIPIAAGVLLSQIGPRRA